MYFTWVCSLIFLITISSVKNHASTKFIVAFEWNYINFTWKSTESVSKFGYIPGEDVIAGIKIYKNQIYLALPRIKQSSRVTLASISIGANKKNPLLSPYPSWEMNFGSNCNTLQNILSMEIDREGIMWILDARRIDNNTDCPPKIVLLDLNNRGKIMKNFIVPNELCPHKSCFLNDIVVDEDYAYISDTTKADAGIFVYDRKSNNAWKARDKTMFGDPKAVNFSAQGVENTGLSHINGIALCCKNFERKFYYMAQTSLHIYSVDTNVLKNRSIATNGDFSGFITDEGTKQGQSGGMICDTADNIYYGLLPLDAVGKWNVKAPLEQAIVLEQNHDIIKWPDSFSIYNKNLYLITNSISSFINYGVDVKETNFRILQYKTNTKSYIYC